MNRYVEDANGDWIKFSDVEETKTIKFNITKDQLNTLKDIYAQNISRKDCTYVAEQPLKADFINSYNIGLVDYFKKTGIIKAIQIDIPEGCEITLGGIKRYGEKGDYIVFCDGSKYPTGLLSKKYFEKHYEKVK